MTKSVLLQGDNLLAAGNGQAWCHGASDDCITSGHPRSSTHHPPRHSPKRNRSCAFGRGWPAIGVSLAGSGGTCLRSRCSYHTHLPPSPRGLIVLTSSAGHMLQLMWAHACRERIAATTSRRRSRFAFSCRKSQCVLSHQVRRRTQQDVKLHRGHSFLYTRVRCSFYITRFKHTKFTPHRQSWHTALARVADEELKA